MPYAASEVVVNTVPSKNIPWIIRTPEGNIKDHDFSVEFIESLIDAVEKLPAKINIPPHFNISSLPRYYLIVAKLDGMRVVEIIDIAGVKSGEYPANLMYPSKWEYRVGYWHPQCQLDIVSVLKKLLPPKQDP
jgi:hypothetical protein